MTFYIHFGIYKAGSSYLQYICANQRDHLAVNNIYFPHSAEDNKMKAGLISMGNADGLEKALIKENKAEVSKILKNWVHLASKNNCKSVLISAEALIHQMALIPKVDILCEVAHKAGFTTLKAMGFFRDLADHAISTYKHRAKTGKHPDYIYWIKHSYETPQLLKNLSDTIHKSKSDIEWTLRKFQKNSEFLKGAFFEDWLKIDVPDFKTQPTVNESLTLSEVMLMNHINAYFPKVTDFFVEDFKTIAKKEKANDKMTEALVYNFFIDNLEKHEKIIDSLNSHFVANENLKIGKKIESGKSVGIILNPKQIDIMFKRVNFFKTYGGLKILMRRKISKMLNLKNFNIL